MAINININLDLSGLSDEAIRSKLAGQIQQIQDSYSREEAEVQKDREVIDSKVRKERGEQRYTNRIGQRIDPREINTDPEVLGQRLDFKNYRPRDKLYGGFWIRIENRPEFAHALFCFTSPGSFGWRVLRYDDIYLFDKPIWEYDYGYEMEQYIQTIYGPDFSLDNFRSYEDIPLFNKVNRIDSYDMLPYGGTVGGVEKGTRQRQQTITEYSLFGSQAKENTFGAPNKGELSIQHQL